MWIFLSAASALVLGVYDLSKKSAVAGNPVLPTLFTTTLSGAACTLPFILLSALHPQLAERIHVFIPSQPAAMHLLILAKSLIVGISWALSYAALKHLPITVASPLRATAPLFTVVGAVVLFGERPGALQWAGIILILAAYLGYSLPSRHGGSQASRGWIVVMLLAALTGSLSAGFDKYLLQTRGLPALFVLGWFLPYLAAMLATALLASRFLRRGTAAPFRLRPTLLLV
ncbi:MAG TPA: DMT family transporter, partial [Fibrobacteria bacterium]|nr:DMT family transporter [Fibrobacteria bacterium]